MAFEKRKFETYSEETLDLISNNINFVTVYELINRTQLFQKFQKTFETLKDCKKNDEKINKNLKQILFGEDFDDFLNLLIFSGQDIAAVNLYPNLEDLCDLKKKDPKYEHSAYFSFGDPHPEDMIKKHIDKDPSLSGEFLMTESPRGYCFLVNNFFTIGTYKEMQKFRNIFFQLHFDVVMDKHLSFDQIEKRITNLFENSQSLKHQAFIFMFLGFGNNDADLIDNAGKHISIDEFTKMYDEKLVVLKNCPKLFFFNRCFIKTKEKKASQHASIANQSGESKNQWLRDTKDLLICYSRFEINIDEFDFNNGTAFGEELSNLLIERSWYKDINSILKSAKYHLKNQNQANNDTQHTEGKIVNKKYSASETISNYLEHKKELLFYPCVPRLRPIISTKSHKDVSFFSSENLSNKTLMKTDGSISLYNNLFITHESFILYRGFFGEPPKKAIIRKYSTFNDKLFEKDNKFLSSLNDDNSNYILKYYGQEKQTDGYYIASELPEQSLETFILKELNPTIEDTLLIGYIKQITEGLNFLSQNNIFNANINPENLFLSIPDRKYCRRVKISNYCFDELQLNNSIKSIPWISFRAVENLRNGEKFIPNEKDYVFSLGCVSYFILTRGKSLFKNGIERLLKNVEPNLVVGLLSDNLNYLEFLKGMIKRQEDGEDGRLSISGVLKHPIFWEPSRKLEYFVNIKNNILLNDEDFKKYASNFFTKKKNALSKLENEKHQLFELNWMTKLPHQIQLYENTKEKHKVTDSHKKSVEGLIKYIRNKEAHWGELPEFVKNELGSTKEGFIELLLGPKHFPNLLILTYNCMKTLKIEGNLVSYYD